ncbi:MAG TPA: hypothetical protein VLT35_06540 [Methanocella sp.]|nr:hypothetical protein [Methanocella sp.]
MALDITEIRLNRRQEKQIMDAARKTGRINLILDGGKVKLSGQDAGDDVSVIDFGNDYYEQLLTSLGNRGIVPSKELGKAIEKVLTDEKVYEDGEFFKAIGEIEGATDKATAGLRKRLEQLLGDASLPPKLRNDYRAILRKLDGNDYRPDYVEKWTSRLLGAEKLEVFEGRLQSAREGFGDAALLHRLYGRIYLRGKDVKGGQRLRWVRLLKPE